jgi:peptidoglycan/LPS O-acetylase OafA/YrhL
MEKTAFGAPAPRLPGLDLVRAVTIAWVMIYHASLFGLDSQDNWLVGRGWMGVDLFFVLSGFLIGGQLLRPWAMGQRPNYRRFFARRALRTLPAYLVVVAAYFLIPAVRDRADIQPLWQFLTFTENLLFDISTPKAFSHVWSLCVEEQFYLLFPAAVALIALKPTPGRIVGAMVAVLVLGMALRGYLWLDAVARSPFDIASEPRTHRFMTTIYYPTWTRLDGLLIGVAASALQAFRPGLWARLTARSNLLLAAGLIGVAASIVLFQDQIAGFWMTVFGFPLLSGSIGLVVISASDVRSILGRYRIPGAGALAAGAYSLYLTHKSVFHAVQLARPGLPTWLQGVALPLALLAALGVGAALHWLVERPFLKLRDRIEGPSRSSLAVVAAGAAAGMTT